MTKVAVSWSGGKESCLACYRAISRGLEVSHLLNFVNKGSERSMGHGLDPELILAQSQAMGIPLVQRETSWETYERKFKDAVLELKRRGVKGIVFGDVDLQEHKDWVEKVCRELDVEPVEPLWGGDPMELLNEFVNAGFEAIVVRVRGDLLGEEWLGRRVNRVFLRDIAKEPIHPLGEKGEYHTFVTNGPIFKHRIRILGSDKVVKDGYHSMVIKKWRVG